MKLKKLTIVTSLVVIVLVLTSCNIILGQYKDPEYCEADSDCVFQSDSCCGSVVNKYHFKGEYRGPICHKHCVPNKFWIFYCNNNKCDQKLNCSDCEDIRNYLKDSGCFEDPSVTTEGMCNELSECGC